MLEPPSLHQAGVFGDGRFNAALQIFPGPVLVAMVTKIGLFSRKIGHNLACTNTRAAEFAPNGVFEDGRINGAIQISCGPILVAMVTKIGYFQTKSAITRLVQMPELPNRRFSDTANLMWYINFSFYHATLCVAQS